MAYVDLRAFIAALDARGQLLRISAEVDPRFELSAYIRKTSDTRGPALWFERVRGCDLPTVGGLYAHRRRVIEALDASAADVVPWFVRAFDALVEPRRVANAPCQEVCHLGAAVDLGRYPWPVYSARDSGPYITGGVVISEDPQDGSKNASIYRVEVQGRDRLGVLAEPPHHLGIHIQKAEALGRPLEVAIALGVAPAVLIATQWQAAYGVDELTLAGALLGEPLPVVRGKTVALDVPASTEIVIEGRVLPGVRANEGPFGEYTGYYTETYPKPVIEVTAITHRRDPIVQALLTGVPTTENHVLKMIPFEASYYRMLKPRHPGVKAVHFTGAGGAGLMIAVALEATAPGEARVVLETLLAARQTKLAVVVDADVDIYDTEQLVWAICMHAQADRDLLIAPNQIYWQLDPSVLDKKLGAGLGIDATRPFGARLGEVVSVPGIDRVPDLQALLARQLAARST